MGYIFLVGAILCEVVGTLSLRAADGVSKPHFVILLVVGYAGAFVLLSFALQNDVPLGAAYAIWAAAGVALVATLSVPLFGETLSLLQGVGLALVIAGVAALQLGGAH